VDFPRVHDLEERRWISSARMDFTSPVNTPSRRRLRSSLKSEEVPYAAPSLANSSLSMAFS
jgi:hypothetical protein